MEVWDILTDMILIGGNLHKINDDDVTLIFLLSLIFTDFVLFFHKDYAIPINNHVVYIYIYISLAHCVISLGKRAIKRCCIYRLKVILNNSNNAGQSRGN